MASEEHKRLSDTIKKVHRNLRLESRKVGADDAWQKHCQQQDILQDYAQAMQMLAVEFWEKNSNDEANCKAVSRIQWIADQCTSYFSSNGLFSAYTKELKMCKKFCSTFDEELFYKVWEECIVPLESKRLKVLDVGSCYNPFKDIPGFDVVAIDIAPASADVIECDFLNVDVVDEDQKSVDDKRITKLQASTFAVVIFCLLLEYLPCPKQRYLCCKKASQLLLPGGLLCVVTPDSKHATANAPIIKGWKFALASLGLFQIYHDKLPHLHCIVYRKCINPNLSQAWLSVKCKHEVESFDQLMVIPQDFHSVVDDDDDTNAVLSVRDEDTNIAATFESLPF